MYYGEPRFATKERMLELFGITPELWAKVEVHMPSPVPEFDLYDLKVVSKHFDDISTPNKTASTDLVLLLIHFRKPKRIMEMYKGGYTEKALTTPLKHLRQEGLIEEEKNGKAKRLYLTDKGLERVRELVGKNQ